jgi:hypothetical protein
VMRSAAFGTDRQTITFFIRSFGAFDKTAFYSNC